MRSSRSSLLATTSLVALSAASTIGMAQPALAQSTLGVYAGGSTLASLVFRQLFDCYAGKTVGGDGYTFAISFSTSPPTPGFLPADCTTWNTVPTHVEGLYAAVGSSGFRGYISNLPDQWYGGAVIANSTIDPLFLFPVPSPPFVDSSNSANFGIYPYPQLDIAVSDTPLVANYFANPTITTLEFGFNPSNNWSTSSGAIAQVAVGGTTLVGYDTLNFGQPIQLPAFEAGVAIAINTTSTSGVTWSINSIKGTPAPGVSGAGSAIQLTGAQLCAIFSGLVTDWSATQTIYYLTNGAQTLAPAAFDYANTINGTGAGHGTGQAPYANASLPITVVYRSDDSGTTFILTNFLHNYCPLLDTGTGAYANGYNAIFGASNLPSTNFRNLIGNIYYYTPPMGAPQHSIAHFLGETGSGGVAGVIGDTATGAGYIGYVSADFTYPYSPDANAPLSASLQDENERINGANIPGGSSTDSGNFIAPTPASVDAAWLDSGLTTPPANTTTIPDFLLWGYVYGQTYATGTTHGNVYVGGKSVLALTFYSEAYPLAGTTFLAAYSCYATSTRSNQILIFLRWLYGLDGSGTTDAIRILANNGFHALQPAWAENLYATYLNARSKNVISHAGVFGGGCPTGAGGAR